MVKRLSEQFAWDDRNVKRLKGYVAADMTKQAIARLLGTTVAMVTAKIIELGIDRPKVKWTGGPKPSTNPEKWGQL